MIRQTLKRAGGLGLVLSLASGGSAVAQSASSHPEKRASEEGALTVVLHHGEVSNRQQVMYQCSDDSKKNDQGAKDMLRSLPDGGRFSVAYLNAEMTALAVLPVDGNVLVMANVIAGSGAKYVADRYVWFTKGDEATFSRADRDEMSVSCHIIPDSEVHHQKGHVEKAASPHKAPDEHNVSSEPSKQMTPSSSKSDGMSSARQGGQNNTASSAAPATEEKGAKTSP